MFEEVTYCNPIKTEFLNKINDNDNDNDYNDNDNGDDADADEKNMITIWNFYLINSSNNNRHENEILN